MLTWNPDTNERERERDGGDWLELAAVVLIVAALAAVVLSIDARGAEPEPTWKLPVPTAISGGPADLRGVLVHVSDEVIQAEDFGLVQSASGGVGLAWVQGYRDDGTSIVIERKLCKGGTPLGFASLAVGADENGFLLAGLIRGEEAIVLDVLEEKCGITRSSRCAPDTCMGICGQAPSCSCWSPVTGEAAPGGCEVLDRTWCSGSCDSNYRCNTSVNNCMCEPLGAGGQVPPGVNRLQRNLREPE